MKRIWLILLSVLLLSACGLDPVMPEVGTPEPENKIPESVDQAAENDIEAEEPDGNEADLYAYFMEDGTIAKYKGEGNEYAAFTLRTTYLPEGHIAVYEDNGGTVILRVYRLGESRAELVKEEPEFYEEYTPTAEELQALKPISLYYQLPIAAGDQVKGMAVIQTDVQVETPYRNFDGAILLEQTSEDGAMLRSYFVKEFGEVKREFKMTEGEEEYIVTSSLESIE
ncbi:hypothetical protein QWY22_14250 [Planococcus liqunii]|uniref:Uncharacterized protein n=1 Tax=Planococcus liqunii TaxID=3058394 RepID=A0ABT8MN35_9BACL|nr:MULTISPECIES: hypothetical protein [unclassified Planococcus (in: firmicutes)]MDN7226275.1 hypothetical protein [Planococcus sp. N064]WKA50053.1 hypothetical protein QWY22_14250 [Planococcus sp. N056]